jgi:cytochrome d ubiquinol oxidase subunit I
MDPLMLSRLQFAAATFFHFLFVPLTLGLTLLIAVMETRYVRSGDETYKRMAQFWGRIFLVNFTIGIVTGITLEFQFGTNWSRYSAYVGDIFGSLLAIEATAAFFLESTFIAVWVFGWNRLSAKAHAFVAWLVFVGANLSAVWILLANGWMQHPVGYVMRNGRAELDSFLAVVTNSFGWQQFLHTVAGSWLLAAMFVMGVAAWHIARGSQTEFFTRSFRMALPLGLATAIFVAGQGHFHGNEVAQVQPAKLAAMEAHWETTDHASMHLLVLPDPDNERNSLELIRLPSLLSLLAYNDPGATVKGLKDFPEDQRPPVSLTFWSFRVMVGLGTLFIALMAWAWTARKDPGNHPWLLKVLPWAIPLPYIALQTGWIVAEVGRQPWIVHGLMRTEDAVSPALGNGQVWFTLTAIMAIYTLLGLAGFWLIVRYARKGPETA